MAMMLPRELAEEFAGWFTRAFHIELRLFAKPKRGEYGRAVFRESLLVVRTFDGSDDEGATNLEVFSSNAKGLEEIERAWGTYLHAKILEETMAEQKTEPAPAEVSGDEVTYTNPLTSEVFTDREKYAESLIRSYVSNVRDAFAVGAENKVLVESIDALVESSAHKGTFEVAGTEHLAKVVRRVNTSYPRPRGAAHPLRELMVLYPDLADMVSVEYSEKGSQVEDLLESFREHALHEIHDADKIKLAEALLAARQCNPGKPAITVEKRKDVRPDSDAPGVGGEGSAG